MFSKHCGKKMGQPVLIIISILFLFLLYISISSRDQAEKIPVVNTASFSETVIYQNSDFRITVTDIQHNRGNIEVKVLVENNSQENATVSCNNFIVNNVMLTALMCVDVSAEAKANGTIYFDMDTLQAAGIKNINTLTSYGAHISFDSRDTLEIEFSLTEDNDYVQSIDEEGSVLYSENGITIISKFKPGKYYDRIPLLIKNKSGQDLQIWTSHVTVNGYTVSEIHYYSPICNGTYRFFDIELSNWGLEESEIGIINTASFSIDFMKPTSTQIVFQTEQLSA